MFDPNSIEIGGVSLVLLILGLVEFAKSFGMDGKKVIALSASMGAILFGLYRVGEFVPAPYSQVYEIVLQSIALGLAASGFYMFVNKRAPQTTQNNLEVDPLFYTSEDAADVAFLKGGLAVPGKKSATSPYKIVQGLADVYVGKAKAEYPNPTEEAADTLKEDIQDALEKVTQALLRRRLTDADKYHIRAAIDQAWAKAYPR